MRKKKWAIAFVSCMAIAGTAWQDAGAADAKGRFSVRGVGAMTCGKYLESRNLNVNESNQYAHWLTGFLTAYNLLQPDTYDMAPPDRYNQQGLLRYLDIYCGKNPKKKIIDAAAAFVRAVNDKRIKSGG